MGRLCNLVVIFRVLTIYSPMLSFRQVNKHHYDIASCKLLINRKEMSIKLWKSWRKAKEIKNKTKQILSSNNNFLLMIKLLSEHT